ncbi:MAG: glycoside hydrolase family 3 C-terminal domain-containing protein [Clostridia bacterium]|nr:glycoside hydrolase family 3 C-terminal domain-containing protein [Clostridia bacterium]
MSNKHIDRIFSKKLAKLIALPITAVICAALMVAVIVVPIMFPILHRVFGGDGVDISGSASVLESADKVVRNTAEESMVLLYNKEDNDGNAYLPQKNLSKVNLFGWGATDGGFLLTGGGSGGATILDKDRNGKDRIKVDLTDAFKEAGIEYNTELTKAYTDFSSFDADYRKGGTTNAYVDESLKNPGADFYSTDRMTQAKTYSKDAVVVLSRWGAENVDNSQSAELKSVRGYADGSFLELTNEEKAMLKALDDNKFDVTVVLNVCNDLELGFLKDYPCIKACIFAGIPGQSGAIAIPEIIKGTVNPSGRLSDTLPYDHQTFNPTYANAAKSGPNIVYQEGIYFGYKWYETADADGYFAAYGKTYEDIVQFPFGFGLSYTTFEWEPDFSKVLTLTKDGSYEVPVKVTNTGSVAGKDVVQLYGHAPYTNGGVEKAERVLLDFAKTPLLEPGDSETVTLSFNAYDLASYDISGNGGYKLDNGKYIISVMNNAHFYKHSPAVQGDKGDYKEINLTTAISIDKDPVTGNTVENLFTGSTAFANCPVDGSSNISYLSRAKGTRTIGGNEVEVAFANFPDVAATRDKGSNPDVNEIKAASKAKYDSAAVNAGVKYGQDANMFLVGAENANGQVERVSLSTLEGNGDTSNLVYNKWILDTLMEEGFDSIFWDSFLNQVTRQETLDLIGKGGFQTVALYSVGKTFCRDKDGPAGFNNSVDDALEAKSDQYTLFCSESLTGCSFSKEIAYSIGEAQAKIAQSVGFQGWYGPGVNLHRSVYNSRNYEYYSEDAVLSGKLAANTISAAYENNMYCYLKHFAVSEAGINPKGLNTWLTEQTLRETYLRPFEIAVKEGKANAMMSAFNKVGGVDAGYNYALLTGVLRNEWGFKGSVITDWFMGGDYMGDYEAGVLAGNDLWLNGTFQSSASLNLDDKHVAYAARQSVKNILYTYIDTNLSSDGVKVNAAPHSTLVVAVQAVAGVLLGLGIIACIVFTVLPLIGYEKFKALFTKKSDKEEKVNEEN